MAQLTAECRRAYPAMLFPLKIAPSHGDLDPHLKHASLGQPESITQTASRSVQPCLHSSRQSVVGHAFPLHNCPFPWRGGIWTLSNTWFLWSTRLSIQNGISIGSAVFAQITADSPDSFYWAPFPKKLPLSTGNLNSHLIHSSLGPPKSSIQTASPSVQPVLQDSLVCQTDEETDRPTDHATRSVTIGRVVVRCGLIIITSGQSNLT